MRAVYPLDHAGLAVLLIDHRRVGLADQLVLVQLFDGVQVASAAWKPRTLQRRRLGLFLSHGASFPWRAWPASGLRA